MRPLAELLAALRQREVALWTEGGRLRFRAPKGAMTPELRGEMARRQEAILAALEAGEGSGGADLVTAVEAGPAAGEDRLGFWRSHLAGAPGQLDLPADRVAPPGATRGPGGRLEIDLGEGPDRALAALARPGGDASAAVLLAVLAALLSRTSGQRELVLGWRPGAGAEGSGGDDLLPLRLDLAGDPSLAELVGRAARVAAQTRAHAPVPWPALAGEIPRPGVVLELAQDETPPAVAELETELELTFTRGRGEDEGRLRLAVTYRRDRFDATTIRRLAGHLGHLLAAGAARPGERLSRLPLLGAAERHHLLQEWNGTAAAVPHHRPFPGLFAQQAEGTPAAVALVFEDVHLSYRRLRLEVAREARRLAAWGVGPERLVGLFAPRGTRFWTLMMAILEAGGAYLPLDPFHPAERQRQVLEQAGASHLLVARELAPTLRAVVAELPPERRPAAAEIEALAGRPEADEPEIAADLAGRTSPEGLAYTIYTSGSTGLPKGAMLIHRGLTNHLFSKILFYGLTADDVVAQSATQSFDVSIWQVLAPLLLGGRCQVLDDEVVRDPVALLDQVERTGVTLVEVVPTQLQTMVEEVRLRGRGRPRLARLRWMMSNGEALRPQLARDWLGFYPRAWLVNAWGLTECSDDQAQLPIRRPPGPEVAALPIGRPLVNMRLHLLDLHFHPVPMGVPGQICVGDVCVGRGYRNRPGRTAGIYVPDPFSRRPGGRLYKTGDLARLLPDGRVDFLGRIDFQVKVRGFRIELGEIEAALAAHPAVAGAVALVWEVAPGDNRIVAYVQPDRSGAATGEADTDLDAAQLRAFARKRLPAYMVPAAFELLAAIPLTTNGKVDRKALPRPEFADG